MEEKLTMEEILQSVPENAAFLKGEYDIVYYNIRYSKSLIESIRHYVPCIYMTDAKLQNILIKNFGFTNYRDIPEFELSDKVLQRIAKKRLNGLLKDKDYVLENPVVYKKGNFNLGYKLVFNQDSNSQNAPKTEMIFLPFNVKTFIKNEKSIRSDVSALFYLTKTMFKKYPDIYPQIYTLYNISLYYHFNEKHPELNEQYQKELQKRFQIIGKELVDPEKTLYEGITTFNYGDLKDVNPVEKIDENNEN